VTGPDAATCATLKTVLCVTSPVQIPAYGDLWGSAVCPRGRRSLQRCAAGREVHRGDARRHLPGAATIVSAVPCRARPL